MNFQLHWPVVTCLTLPVDYRGGLISFRPPIVHGGGSGRRGGSPPAGCTMKPKTSVLVLLPGILLARLSLLAYRAELQIARSALIVGGAGGALCIGWGILGLLGCRCKAGFVLTMIPVSFTLFSLAVFGWIRSGEAKSDSFVALMTTVMFLAAAEKR
jgi:hypothetical protein